MTFSVWKETQNTSEKKRDIGRMKRIIEWMRQVLRRWLLGVEKHESYVEWLECVIVIKGVPEKKTYYIVGSAGMNLIGKPLGEKGEVKTLIRHSEAVDGERYWELWKKYNGDVSLEWEESEVDKCRKQ
jgi:hypothetical protein